ncbi:MAG: DUF4124 domain-containing protein [Janthinobacterium lividum]
MNNASALLVLILSAASLAPLSVQAQIFICKDAKGKTHTSDRPIEECNNTAMREVDKSGVTRREIAAPLTAEQKRQAQIDEQKRKAEAVAAADQRNNDRAIMARFRNEDDIAVARQRSTDQVREALRQSRANYVELESRRTTLQAQVDQLQAGKKRVPADVTRKLDDTDAQLASQSRLIGAQEAEFETIEARFDATLKRFRELMTQTAHQ